ncbi:MAG TPA: hypothetical protein VJB94_03235 [Candidatus Nanoarchaeia archaeon]|nr:hypothetical protein [Candidatus Nanoarchaeia archaeon]
MSLDFIDLDKELCKKISSVYDLDPNNKSLRYVDVDAALDGRLVYKPDFLIDYNDGKTKLGINSRLNYGMDLDSAIQKFTKKPEMKVKIKEEAKKSFFERLTLFFKRQYSDRRT